MRIGAVIDAAGNKNVSAERFGNMLKVQNLTMAERIVLNFQQAGVKDIVVLTGCQAEKMEKSLQHYGVTFLRDEAYEKHKLTDSVKKGMDYLGRYCDRILFCPMDVPFFKTETVRILLEQEADMIVPTYGGKQGYPICIKASLNHVRLEEAFKESYEVQVEDSGIIPDNDIWQRYEEIEAQYEEKQMHPSVKVRLAKQKPFFGPGIVTVLRQIERVGSVREACQKTGISYSKGWTLIHTAEEELGYKIVERMPGGKNGGEAYVTERGRMLLSMYESYAAKVEQAAEEIYKEIFLDSDLF